MTPGNNIGPFVRTADDNRVGMEVQTTANYLKGLVGAPGLEPGPDD
jgi:hypothetical protein